MTETVVEFITNDAEYQFWLRLNPNGYVINARRNMAPDYMVLHTATCKTIGNYDQMARPGGFTERDYIKICASTVEALRGWVKERGRTDGSFSGQCSQCKPI
jgi:hypothetical protein